MAQTFTPTAVTSGEGVQYNYPMQMDLGLPGQIADLAIARVITGNNETTLPIEYGIPVVANSSGVLNNSCKPATGAGAALGIVARSAVHEKLIFPAIGEGPNAIDAADGVPPLKEVNLLTQGTIYLLVMEAVAPGDTLRYHKSGANAGRWGKTASAGNTLALVAGNWAIRKGAAAGQVLALELNAPAALTFTADA